MEICWSWRPSCRPGQLSSGGRRRCQVQHRHTQGPAQILESCHRIITWTIQEEAPAPFHPTARTYRGDIDLRSPRSRSSSSEPPPPSGSRLPLFRTVQGDQTAELALFYAQIKVRYGEKTIVSETICSKLRNELRLLKEDAAIFTHSRCRSPRVVKSTAQVDECSGPWAEPRMRRRRWTSCWGWPSTRSSPHSAWGLRDADREQAASGGTRRGHRKSSETAGGPAAGEVRIQLPGQRYPSRGPRHLLVC